MQALIDAHGWLNAVQSLTEVLILTSFVVDAGYGQILRETWLDAEAALNAAFVEGRDEAVWRIDANGSARVKVVLAMHDAQLDRAPLGVLAGASERLDRLKAG